MLPLPIGSGMPRNAQLAPSGAAISAAVPAATPSGQQQQQQPPWTADRILQQMGNHIHPFSSIMQSLSHRPGMSATAQLAPSNAVIPAAGVASMFLQLDSKLSVVCSKLAAVEAAVRLQRLETAEPGSSMAAGPGAAPPGNGIAHAAAAAVAGNAASVEQ